MRSSIMSRALWARKWYFNADEGAGRGLLGGEGWRGVEDGLANVFR